ncbi:hypothetical protein LUB13_00315 [Lactobacillus delbrueckii subsp. lactis]|uniref:hypothetical protein n=1 Tax=Lactobacillus delbrueckii TaxID=1584 RepID=UPI001E4CCD7C|nr:hypothetical protein [Lactobacillus delbrueckii]MCD9217872.1 hypothetical protein [Lactobacillus delbrueckii subsp. lactis]
MSFEINGLSEFQKKIEKLEQLSKKEHSVSLVELFTDTFMTSNTSFDNCDDFFKSIGIDTEEQLKAMPEEQMDEFVAKNTSFSSWQEMLATASSEYALHQAGF